MNNKTYIVALIVVAIIAISSFFIGTPSVVVNVPEQTRAPLGGQPGPEYTDMQYFYGGAGLGSECFSTTTTGTLTARTLKDNGCIRIAAAGAGQAALSLTLPATTTMSSVLPRAGMCRDWFIDADGVAAATTTTIVAGTCNVVVGLDATGQGTGADVIDGDEMGTLRLCRLTNGDIAAYVQEYIHAD
jgi:hypothetical protein